MEKNGIELGAMNAKLLEKIEELHLYILQQQKKMDEQNKKIDDQELKWKEQQKQIDELKKMVAGSK